MKDEDFLCDSYGHDCKQLADTAEVSKSDLIALLSGKVSSIDKYRSTSMVNTDYDKARVVLELTFPEDLRLYYALKAGAR